MASAIATLTRIYTDRKIQNRGRPVVGVTSNTVPWELLRAAGLHPIVVSPRRNNTPLANRYMESVFSSRMKAVFDFLLSPESAVLSAVVIPRTSEQEHKLYLYLREVIRQGEERAPEPILYNLLHARSPEAEAYGLERTHDLKAQLERLTGRRIEPGTLSAAIAEGNAARQAVRGLLQQREGPAPRLCGSEALPLIGAWYFMDRGEYPRLRGTQSRKSRCGHRSKVREFCSRVRHLTVQSFARQSNLTKRSSWPKTIGGVRAPRARISTPLPIRSAPSSRNTISTLPVPASSRPRWPMHGFIARHVRWMV